MINELGLFNRLIINVAVADMDATYGAYGAVENSTVTDTKDSKPKMRIIFFLVDQGKDCLFSLVLQ